MIAGVPDGVRAVVAGQDLIRDGDKVNVSEIDITKAAEGLERTLPNARSGTHG